MSAESLKGNAARLLLLAGWVAGVGAWSCSSGDLCASKQVKCSDGLSCDPGDGVCKCGGQGGVVCPDRFVCDPAANVCVAARCQDVDCSERAAYGCDLYDGQCKCGGTGGPICTESQVCNGELRTCVNAQSCDQLTCPQNQTCDEASVSCSCGGATCGAGETCQIGDQGARSCVPDACSGVHCAAGLGCDPADGVCKCNGSVCVGGQACACPQGQEGCGETDKLCRASTLCEGVVCGGGTTCDFADGLCKCGGPGGPACGADQTCILTPFPRCQGGDACLKANGDPVECEGGTSCDSEDGICKCGGRGGTVCPAAAGDIPAEICISTATERACRKPCDVRLGNCAQGTHCYFDSLSATPAAYCAPPGGSILEGEACATPTACFDASVGRPLHCAGIGVGSKGLCRPYCDVGGGLAGCSQFPTAQTCSQIVQAPVNYGACKPQ